jgi:23S rRNA pseudouridine955/2504/2580 synthase
MHQIRRHLALLGAPILGDGKYGNFSLNRKLRKEYALKHLLLHARRISFEDGGKRRTIEAPLPDYFRPFIEMMEKPCP